MKYTIATIALLLVSLTSAKDLYKELLTKLEDDKKLLIKLENNDPEDENRNTITNDVDVTDLHILENSEPQDAQSGDEIFLDRDGLQLDEFAYNEQYPINRGEHDGDYMADGDIMYRAGEAEVLYGEQKNDIQNDGLRSASRRWPNGVVPYEIHANLKGISAATRAINDAVKEYATKTCISLRPRRSSDRNYILFFKGGGCWSYVGMSRGRQLISLGSGCHFKSTAIHEVMHAIGFYHEQSRPDRDNYVKIHTENIRQGMEGNFRKQSINVVSFFGHSYDYESVMHYSRFAFTKNRKPTISATRGSPDRTLGQPFRGGQLTLTDAGQINNMYQCSNPGVTTTTRPIVTTTPGGGTCNNIKSALTSMRSTLSSVISIINRLLRSTSGDAAIMDEMKKNDKRISSLTL